MMDAIIKLICSYVDKTLTPLASRKINKKVYGDFALLAKYAYDNRSEGTCSTWLLRELLRCNMSPSAHQGFWQTFDAFVGDAFTELVSKSINQVLDNPIKHGFNESDVFKLFLEHQIKDVQPRTLLEEIRWVLAGIVRNLICSIAIQDEYKVLCEICFGDFGQLYIEHLLLDNDDAQALIVEIAECMLG